MQEVAKKMKAQAATTLVIDGIENFDGERLKYFEDVPIYICKFRNMTLDKKALEHVNNHSLLVHLGLDGCKPLSTIITKPGKLSNLQELSLVGVTLSKGDCESIPKLKSLGSVRLLTAKGFSPDFLRSLGSKPTLKKLFFGGDQLTDEYVNVLPETNFQEIEVFNCPKISADTLMRNIGRMKRLSFLNINDYTLAGGPFRHMETQKTYHFIKLNSVKGLSKEDFVSLSRSQNLEEVELVQIQNLHDDDILPLLSSKLLRKLELNGVANITKSAEKQFRDKGITVKNFDNNLDIASFVERPSLADTSTKDGAITDSIEPANRSWSSPPRTVFDSEQTCELHGTYTDEDMVALVENVKKNHPNHRGFQWGIWITSIVKCLNTWFLLIRLDSKPQEKSLTARLFDT